MITASLSLLSTYTRRNTILYLLLTLHYTHHTHKSTAMCVVFMCNRVCLVEVMYFDEYIHTCISYYTICVLYT